MELVGQLLSLAGMTCNIGSMQCKKVKHLYFAQFLGATLWSLSYLFIASPAGAVLNLYSVLRTPFLMGKGRWQSKPALVGLGLIWLTTAVLSYLTDGWRGILPALGQLLATVGMLTRDNLRLRIFQLAGVSPLWMTYNIIVGSIGGILCECFTITSVVISLFRLGRRPTADAKTKEDPT